MGKDSKIAWTDHTFNPWIGCTKASPGCTHCYAETFDKRTGGDHWGAGKVRRRTSPANWREPLRWNKAAAAGRFVQCDACGHRGAASPRGERLFDECCGRSTSFSRVRPRVFCASMADWLDPEVPAEWLADLLALIYATPHLDWLLLTKRPERWLSRLQNAHDWLMGGSNEYALGLVADWLDGTPPPNVWVGCTVEDQRRADERIPALLSIPARVRFLSCEPLLEGVDLTRGLPHAFRPGDAAYGWQDQCSVIAPDNLRHCGYGPEKHPRPTIDWVIVGGESGPKARPFDVAWARSIRDQCAEAGVAFFMKQDYGPKSGMRGRIEDDLWVKEFPDDNGR